MRAHDVAGLLGRRRRARRHATARRGARPCARPAAARRRRRSRPLGGMPTEPGHDQPAEGLVGPVVGNRSPVLSVSSSGRSTPGRCQDPSAARAADVRRRSCSSATSPTSSSTTSSSVTTPDVPPYSSTTTAICRPELTQLDEQRAQVHGLGHLGCVHHERRGGDLGAALERHRDGPPHVHEADDVVVRVADHGEAGVPCRAGQRGHVRGGVVPSHDDEALPVRHDVDGGQLEEVDRVGDQRGRRLVERALQGRAAHEGDELLRRAATGQLLAAARRRTAAATCWRCR